MDLQQLQLKLQPWLTDKSQASMANVASLLLVVVILYQMAGLVWMFVPEPVLPTTPQSTISPSSTSQSAKKLDISALIRASLFGNAADKPKVEAPKPVTDAPKTRLNLKLTGVVASSDPKMGGAIIVQGGNEDVYGIGEKIGSTRAILRQILADRVIIEQNSRPETLMLEGQDYTRQTAAAPATEARTAAPEEASSRIRSVGRQVESLRQDVRQNPTKIMDYINISPARVDGKLAGYRLRPGKDAKLFREIGLQPGDLAISINGLDLSNPQQAREALNALRKEDQVSIVVLRDDQEISVELSAQQQ